MSMTNEHRISCLGGVAVHKIVYLCAQLLSLAFCLSTTVKRAVFCNTAHPSQQSRPSIQHPRHGRKHRPVLRPYARCVWNRVLGHEIFRILVVHRFCYVSVRAFRHQSGLLGPVWLIISHAVNSTLVFFAISYRIANESGPIFRLRNDCKATFH
ncbi:hypothetical protein FIBSPDRAFT_192517 [Athelia psychrophila]|uniref:Uncharacterized protein n=1 Tax=Athelia psychrophila TaxID=1759441 RepID=A0A166SFQ3_9AGAM|nr:hypothetical protein FIBSPDRAFT_192517 [Fibularhizoctonia sp. CBS 109695]